MSSNNNNFIYFLAFYTSEKTNSFVSDIKNMLFIVFYSTHIDFLFQYDFHHDGALMVVSHSQRANFYDTVVVL